MTKPSRSKAGRYWSNVMVSLPQLQDADGVAAVNLLLNVVGQLHRIEQLELWHLLVGHQEVGPEQQLIGPAEEERTAELRITGNSAIPAGFRQVAIEVFVLLHQPVESTTGSHWGRDLGI